MKKSELYSILWEACNKLRGGVEPARYKDYVLVLLFFKYVSDRYKNQPLADFSVPEGASFDDLIAAKWTSDVGERVDKIIQKFLEANKLQGSLPEVSFNNAEELGSGKELVDKVSGLIAVFQNPAIDFKYNRASGDDIIGDAYEYFMMKFAQESGKSKGQFYTPSEVSRTIARLIGIGEIKQEPNKKWTLYDPACGTFGFMIAAHRYVKEHTDDFYDLDADQAKFEREEAFTGCELVHDTHRLALMNAMLHDIDGQILLADTLSNQGKALHDFDLVLTNPPFGTKKGGERATRDDFTFPTSNKQLNFLQHIYRSLKANGKARAAVVLPDNVLFADGDGEKIRCDLMDKCALHTILRLPTGIFYAQGVKTNVLFFTRGKSDKGNTKEVWFYDLRTNMPSFGKTTPLKTEHFADFEKAYEAEDRHAVQDERWSVFTREQIAEKGNSLDLGLIRDDSVLDYDDLPDPVESAEEAAANLEEAVDLLMSVVKELRALEVQD